MSASIAPRTLLIGLDGATFTILDPLMEQGVMPFLRELARRGVRAGLRSIVPPLTPPAWTSLLTGRTPGHHGIYDFFQLDAPGSKQIRLTTAHDVRCETIAAIANRQGLRATVLNFPVHFPPPAIDGYVLAGWMPWRQLRLGAHPAELYDELKGLPGFDPRELAMDMELEARATEGCPEDDLADWVKLHIRREQHWADVTSYLLQAHPTPLTAVLFDGPDKIQHLCWRYMDPALQPAQPTAAEQRVRDLCIEFFRQLDSHLARLCELAGPEATVILASDHGFGATTEVFHINSWLEQAGYLTWADGARPAASAGEALGMSRLSRHTYWLDWRRTRAYVATPTSNGVHIVRAEDNDGYGVPTADYERFRAELSDALRSYRDPVSGEPIVARIWTREEAFPGPAAAWGPDLTLALRDGGLVSILPTSDPASAPLVPRPRPVGAHRPLGVFLARGPGIRQGMTFRELSILDVAPLLLYSLGLAIPKGMEGRAPLEIYQPAFRTRRPLQTTAATPTLAPSHAAASGRLDAEAEAVMLARLRDLGYIE
jgi:predicted AlkP superfamily phosphohydrolase/phosphomutase